MLLITLIIMMTLTGAEVDLYISSFPELQNIFNLSAFKVELTLSINLIAHCLISFIVGNLGDKYGRKPVIIFGLTIFIFGSFLCVFANNYYILLLGRFLQGVGIAAPSVLSFSVISDLYPLKKQQELMGVIHGSVAFGMAGAPVIGSYVSLFFNWQGNFVLLAILGIISLLLSIIYIPFQPIKTNNISLSLKEYFPLIKSQKTMLYIIVLCFGMQVYWVFIGMSPILYMKDLGVDLKSFGLYQGAVAATFSIVSLSSGYFLKRFGALKCFVFSLFPLAIFFSLSLIIATFKIQDPMLITINMLFQAVSMVYPINILWPLALNAIDGAKARISALLSAVRLILSAIIIEVASFYYDGTFFTIGLAICFCLTISGIACFILLKKNNPLQNVATQKN